MFFPCLFPCRHSLLQTTLLLLINDSHSVFVHANSRLRKKNIHFIWPLYKLTSSDIIICRLQRDWFSYYQNWLLSVIIEVTLPHFQENSGTYKLDIWCTKLSQQTTFWNIFLILSRKQDLTFHTSCLRWRQFTLNVKSCFLEKIRKNIITLSSAEFAQRVVKVKCQSQQQHFPKMGNIYFLSFQRK